MVCYFRANNTPNHAIKEAVRKQTDNTMKIAIFEDDRYFAAQLETLIRQYTHRPTAINTGVADEIINWIKKTAEPVLYLLDIMSCGKATGFQIARHISEHQSASGGSIGSLVVFITAYPQNILYNPDFKIRAFSIILKSAFSLEREIEETISLATKALRSKSLYIHIGKFESLYIPHEKICYAETIKSTNKLCIHCTDGQYVIRETLKNLLMELTPFGFVRCHKSIVANKANIRKKDKSSMTLTFHNGTSCPFSYLMRGSVL